MKKLILSLVSLLTCLCFSCFAVAYADDSEAWLSIIEDTAFSFLVGSSDLSDSVVNDLNSGATGLTREVAQNALSGAFLNATDENGLQFTIPSYDILSGKYMLHYQMDDETEDDILIECTLILSDRPEYLTNLKPIKVREYGDVYYYGNCLNYTITRTDGTVKRYIVALPTGFDYRNSPTLTASEFLISGQRGCTVYEYKGGSNLALSRPLKTAQTIGNVKFNMATVNTVRVNLRETYTPPSQYDPYPFGFWGSASGITAGSPVGSPSDIDIVCGAVSVRYNHLQNPTQQWHNHTFLSTTYFCTSFATTNNPNRGAQMQNKWTLISNQNYYYNDYIQGGTVINENNYHDYYDGAFAPAFDIDPDLPLAEILGLLADLLPDFDADIKPTLDLSVDSLFDRLLDYYGNMPDIGFQWDPDLDNNNYWDIQLPDFPSDSGGGGSGGDYKPWEPPEYKPVNTAPFIPATYPTIPTGTLPVSFAQNMGGILQDGWDIFDHLDVLAVLCPLVVIVLLWRITGK